MADTDFFSKASNIVAFIVSFIHRFTVQLAVEFLKIIILLAILVSACGVLGLGFMSLVVWAYVTYDGSLVAGACAVVLGAVLVVAAAIAVQFLVKDVLCLTDMPLLHLVRIYITALTGRKKSGRNEDAALRSNEVELSSTKSADQQVKKNY